LINIVVFLASQSVEENEEDDAVERRVGGGGSALYPGSLLRLVREWNIK
jgi:hypothetical protein